MKNNHIIVMICFNNVEHIKKSFDSMLCDGIDYFIIENKSKFSDKIKNYFLDRKNNHNNIIGYIQFEKNIVANAVNIFLKDFIGLLEQYEYITITDGDYYVYDIKSTIDEILMAFGDINCVASSVEIYQYSNFRCPNRIIGTEYYDEYMLKRQNIEMGNIPTNTGTNSLMTIQKKDLSIIKNQYFNDCNTRQKINSMNKLWYVTNKNRCYHLTDECCYDAIRGDEYMTWKRGVGQSIWHVTEVCDYVKFI